MNKIKIWLKASRIQSQSYIFLPLLFGQAFFVYQGNQINWTIFTIMTLFGLFDQFYIVYANDYADFETDCRNETFNIFSGGSRVLADKELQPIQLLKSSVVMAVLCLICGIALTMLHNRVFAVPIVIIALLLLFMYSYSPVKLSYRGGGEILQMVGVGIVLPLFGYYAQSGEFTNFPWFLLAVILPTQLACAMATSLPDEPSDKQSGKRTMSVISGAKITKLTIIVLNTVSIVFLYAIGGKIFEGQIYAILIIPLIATFLQLFLTESKPGSLKLTIFVTLAVLITLTFMGAMSAVLLF